MKERRKISRFFPTERENEKKINNQNIIFVKGKKRNLLLDKEKVLNVNNIIFD